MDILIGVVAVDEHQHPHVMQADNGSKTFPGCEPLQSAKKKIIVIISNNIEIII